MLKIKLTNFNQNQLTLHTPKGIFLSSLSNYQIHFFQHNPLTPLDTEPFTPFQKRTTPSSQVYNCTA